METEELLMITTGLNKELDEAADRITQLKHYRRLNRETAEKLENHERTLRLQIRQMIDARDYAVADLQSGLVLAIKEFRRSIEAPCQ